MIENWAQPGMPPEEYDVLDKFYRFYPDGDSYYIFYWLRGEHPHKGTVIHDGWQGTETIVEFDCFPGLKSRLNKNQRDVEKTHPLYRIFEQKRINRIKENIIYQSKILK